MPSGAKKRKAAKKKKGQKAGHSAISHSLDEVKQHDSDGEESGSPTSHDLPGHQHPYAEEREETAMKREGNSWVHEKTMEGSKTVDNNRHKMTNEEGGVIQIDKEMKPANRSERECMKINGVECPQKLHVRGLSGSSSSSSSISSSDDESHIGQKESTVAVTAQIVVNSIEADDTLCQSVTHATESTPVVYNEESVFVGVPDKVSKEDVIQINENATVDYSESSIAMGLDLKETGEENLPLLVVNTEIATFSMNTVSQKVEDVVLSISEEHAVASSGAMASEAQEEEDGLLLSFNSPKVVIDDEKLNGYDVPECSDNLNYVQPLVGSAPPPVQKASWKSCCGLFEVFASSNR